MKNDKHHIIAGVLGVAIGLIGVWVEPLLGGLCCALGGAVFGQGVTRHDYRNE